MSRLKNRKVPSRRARQFTVHMPRNPSEPEEFARFTASLNHTLGLISDRVSAIPPALTPDFEPLEYVKKKDLDSLIDAYEERIASLTTSENEEGAQNSATRSSRRRRRGEEAAESAIVNAQPLAAPPNVAAASSIGTTIDPFRFSLEDHTHGGILGNPVAGGVAGRVLFFTSTFQVNGEAELFWDSSTNRLGIGTDTPDTDLDVERSASGGTVGIDLQNTSNTASSIARLSIQVAGSTADDPFLLFDIASVQQWAIGIDNSDSDKWKLSRSTALGTNDAIVVTTGNLVGINISTPLARLDIFETTVGNDVVRVTSDATATTDNPNYVIVQDDETTTDGLTAILHTFNLDNNTAYHFEVRVVARRTGGTGGTAGDVASYLIIATYRREGGGGATLIGAVNAVHTGESVAGWNATLVASGNDVTVQILGDVDNNISWHMTAMVQKVSS